MWIPGKRVKAGTEEWHWEVLEGGALRLAGQIARYSS